jgi:cytochrome c biogenesis protein CcmG/thiol:disulfide interchange protein DsbE
MNLRWAIAALGALALAFVTVPAPWTDGHIDAAAPAGSACPANAKAANMNFTLKDLDNKDVKLAAFKGKVVLLDFWATWCGPCKIEIPWFIEFQQKYGKSGLNVIGVLTEDTVAKAKPFAAEWKMNYTLLSGIDRDDLDDAYGPMFGLPVTILISRDGKICAKHVGLSSKDAFEKEIKALL